MACAADLLNVLPLPSAEGSVIGAAFSPDSKRLAVLRHVSIPGVRALRRVLQVVDLGSGKEMYHAQVLDDDGTDNVLTQHFVSYSHDGRYLLLASGNSGMVTVLDAMNLEVTNRIALATGTEPHQRGKDLSRIRIVVGLAVASDADVFSAMTFRESERLNEIFIGSLSSGQITNHWVLGRGYVGTRGGRIGPSVSADGTRVAVPRLPEGERLPKGFDNVRLYDTNTGRMVKALRTGSVVGRIIIISGAEILAARIDSPGLLSRKACIERWNLDTGSLEEQFCDPGRNVNTALGASISTGRIVGFGARDKRDIEGNIYAAPGRVDVWDMRSGDLVAFSPEVPSFPPSIQISKNGEWVMAGQSLFRFGAAPRL